MVARKSFFYGFYGYTRLLFQPHRQRLFLAEQISESQRTRESLLRAKSTAANTVIAVASTMVLLQAVFFRLPLLLFLLLLLLPWLGYCYLYQVYGAGRAAVLRYAYYAGQPELADPAMKKLLRRLSGRLFSAGDYTGPESRRRL